MRKLVIPSRELQVHMSIITTINIFETVTYSRSVLRASQSARLCRSCNQRDARTIWLISRPFCAISTRILSKQVLLLRSRTMSIAPVVNTMASFNPSFTYVILKQYYTIFHSMISMNGLTTLYLMLPTSLIIDLEQPRLRLSYDQAWQQIVRIAGVSNSSEFQKLDREAQWQAFIQLKELGASVRQLQRLTGIDRGIIQRAR